MSGTPNGEGAPRTPSPQLRERAGPSSCLTASSSVGRVAHLSVPRWATLCRAGWGGGGWGCRWGGGLAAAPSGACTASTGGARRGHLSSLSQRSVACPFFSAEMKIHYYFPIVWFFSPPYSREARNWCFSMPVSLREAGVEPEMPALLLCCGCLVGRAPEGPGEEQE